MRVERESGEIKVKSSNPGANTTRTSLIRPILLFAAVIASIILARAFGLGARLGDLREWIASLGNWGPLAFVLVYAAATVAAIPGSVLSVAAGAIFGPVIGVLTVITGATMGAALAFLVSRYFAREAVNSWLKGNEKFGKLDDLTEKHGAFIVALTRLVPLFPFNLLNYGFGLTKVPFWTYVGWSALCMLPGTILYVVGSAAVFSAISAGRIPWALIGLVVLVSLVLILVIGKARKKLQDGRDEG